MRRALAAFTAVIVALGMMSATGVSASADPATGSISGIVTTAGSVPVPGVAVATPAGPTWGDATTGPSGEYTISGLLPGEYMVWFGAHPKGFLDVYWENDPIWGEVVTVVAGADTPGINAELVKPAIISGTVTSSVSGPIANVEITAGGRGYNLTTTTDSLGHYSFDQLPANYYTISFDARSQNYPLEYWPQVYSRDDATEINIAAGETIDNVDAELTEGASISGNVKNSANPAANLENVKVTAATDSGLVDHSGNFVTTSSNGDFAILGLLGGEYQLQYEASGYASDVGEDLVTVATGGAVAGVQMVLEPESKITGRVTGALAPLDGIENVYVWLTDEPQEWPFREYGNLESTDANGYFTFEGLLPGTYHVATTLGQVPQPTPYLEGETSVEVTVQAEGVANQNFVLEEGGSMSGTVTADGEALNKGYVTIYGDFGYRGVQTDSFGEYTVIGLPTDDYLVNFGDDWQAGANALAHEWWPNVPSRGSAETVGVVAGSETSGIDADLSQGSSFSGTVKTGAGDPYEGGSMIGVWDANGERVHINSSMDLAGAYTVSGLPAGAYKLGVSDKSFGDSRIDDSTDENGDLVSCWVNTGYADEKFSRATADIITISGPGEQSSGHDVVLTDRAEFNHFASTPAPTISGLPRAGNVLTAAVPEWSPATGHKLRWLKDGAPIGFTDSATYTVRPSDVGHEITVAATANRSCYLATSVTSTPVLVPVGDDFVTNEPMISGAAQVGETLTATTADWDPVATTMAYQWSVGGVEVTDATDATYEVIADDLGKKVTVAVTGAKSGYITTTVSSAETAAVVEGMLTVGTVTIIGAPTVGNNLTAELVGWGPVALDFTYVWKSNGSPIAGETGHTFRPTAAQGAKTLSVTATASAPGYDSASNTSDGVEIVQAPMVSATPTITGTPVVGGVLTADAGTWGPTGVALSYQWTAGGSDVGVDDTTYSPVAADVGKTITVKVTGSLATYTSVTKTSAATAAVVAADAVPTPTRIAGSNRYDTAAKVALNWDDASVVYVTNGLGFADALSAGPAAAFHDAPLLLTTANVLSPAAKTQLERLEPTKVIIVGGTGVVSAAVESQIAALSFTHDHEVHRIGGSNRYETSRMLAAETFTDSGATTAYLADGRNFPDALTASPAASDFQGPVILVPGNATAVDTKTLTLLDDLGVTKVKIAGGNGVVSAAIQTQMNQKYTAGNVKRNSGGNRYATAVAINADQFTSESVVYLATGTGFADALAGAALAGSKGAPLFITEKTCVPASVLAAISSLGATSVVLLGGPGVLSTGVENMQSCG